MAVAHRTAEFLVRHAVQFHPGMVPRMVAGFSAPAVGNGCFRTLLSAPDTVESLAASLCNGCNLIDTASNYDEEAVGRAIHTAIDTGKVDRQEILLLTKAGTIQHKGMAVARARETTGTPYNEVVKLHSGLWHCIQPAFLREQLENSTNRLGTPPDGLLLHNPEFFYTAAKAQGIPKPEEEFNERLRRAFVCLEELVAEGRLQFYGVSSNTEGCYYSVSGGPNTYEATSLPAMVLQAEAAAKEVGLPRHHFRVLQVPFNLLEPGALFSTQDGWGQSPTVTCALNNDISIMGNRPLKSIPPAGFGAGDWGKEAEHLKLADTVPMRTSVALLRNLLHDNMQGVEGHSRRMSLSQLALWVACSAPGLSCTLAGATQLRYLDDVFIVMNLPPLPSDVVVKCLRTIDAALQEMTAH